MEKRRKCIMHFLLFLYYEQGEERRGEATRGQRDGHKTTGGRRRSREQKNIKNREEKERR